MHTRTHSNALLLSYPLLRHKQRKTGCKVVDDRRGGGFLTFKGARKAGSFCCTPDTDENYTRMKNRWMKSFPDQCCRGSRDNRGGENQGLSILPSAEWFHSDPPPPPHPNTPPSPLLLGPFWPVGTTESHACSHENGSTKFNESLLTCEAIKYGAFHASQTRTMRTPPPSPPPSPPSVLREFSPVKTAECS